MQRTAGRRVPAFDDFHIQPAATRAPRQRSLILGLVKCMMRSLIRAALGCFLLAGCASKEPNHGGDYKMLSARPTPLDWAPGAVWTFVTTKTSGEQDTLTFRVTDELAKTCTDGVWRKLNVMSGHVPQSADVTPQPAYMVEGSFLWIDINAPW
jgi:hypothetical protein